MAFANLNSTITNLSSDNGTDVSFSNWDVEENLTQFENLPGDFGTLNTVRLHTNAGLSGASVRAKGMTITLYDQANTSLDTIVVPQSMAVADTDYDSGTPIDVSSYTEAQFNSFYTTITVEEGGGMPDSVTVDVDWVWLETDYDIAATVLTASLFTEAADTFYAAGDIDFTLTSALFDESTDTFYTPDVQQSLIILEAGLYTETADVFYSSDVELVLTASLFTEAADTFYAAGDIDFTLTASLFDESTDTFYAAGDIDFTLTASLFSDTPDTFYTPQINLSITGDALLINDTPDTFYSSDVELVLTSSLFSDTPDTFYALDSVDRGPVSVTASLFSDTPDTFYAASVDFVIDVSLFTEGADTFYSPHTMDLLSTLTASLFDEGPDGFISPHTINLSATTRRIIIT